MDILKLAAAIILTIALWGVFFRLFGNVVENVRMGIRRIIKYMNNE